MGMNAVVCEDLADLRRAFGVMLRDGGFNILAAVASADEALAAVRATQPELVVIDLALSGSFGLEIIPALIGAAARCRVVAVSALLGLHDDALAAGALELTGPNDLRPLRRALLAVLNDELHGCTCGSGSARARAKQGGA